MSGELWSRSEKRQKRLFRRVPVLGARSAQWRSYDTDSRTWRTVRVAPIIELLEAERASALASKQSKLAKVAGVFLAGEHLPC